MIALLIALGFSLQITRELPIVTVAGLDGQQIQITATDLKAFPRKTVTATSHGATHTYEGVGLADVLKRAGVRFGELLRGPQLANYLLVEARDGYRVVFALPELDVAFTDREVILADTEDGKPLPTDDGPFRIVVPGEKRGARWVRQVTTLRVMAAAK